MRKSLLAAYALTAAAVVIANGGDALAQTQKGPSKPKPRWKATPLNLHESSGGGLGDVGRARMRGGDCEGAINAFDAALETSLDASLHRDRGLCHEQLGHPYPAIDDYEAYLTADNEAPDADDIRLRLRRLQDKVNDRVSTADDDSPTGASGAGSGGDGSTATGTASVGASAGAGAGSGGAKVEVKTSRQKLDYAVMGDDPLNTPFARGRGMSLGPFLSLHKWFPSGVPAGQGDTFAECVGLQFRATAGGPIALFIEAAYQRFNSSDSDTSVGSGLTSLIGLELRYAFDAEYNYQLFFTPGIGYELLNATPTDPEFASITTSYLAPRGRIGFRMLLQRTAALDFSLDGGAAVPVGSSLTSTTVPLFALNVALVWGL
jgi:hypothetical protein